MCTGLFAYYIRFGRTNWLRVWFKQKHAQY